MNKIFSNRNFVLLWASQIIEQLGNGLNLMAMIAWVISFSDNPSVNTAGMSLLMASMGVPIALFGPFAGVIVDRLKKQNVLLLSGAARGIFVLVTYFIIGHRPLSALVFVLVFLISVAAQVVLPGRSSYIPLLVRKKSLLQANSLSAITAQAVQLIGMAGGGLLVAKIGVADALLINFITFVISIGLLLLIRKNEIIPEEKSGRISKVLSDVMEGFSTMLSVKKISFYIRRITAFMVMSGFFYIAFTGNFLVEVLKSTGISMEPIAALSAVLLSLGGGFVAGVFRVNKLQEVFGEVLLFRAAFPLIGILIAGSFLFRNFYYLLFMMAVCGAAAVIFLGIAETAIQNSTKAALRGRVFAAYHILKDGGLILSSSLAGIMMPFIGHSGMVLLVGMVFIGYGAVNILHNSKDI